MRVSANSFHGIGDKSVRCSLGGMEIIRVTLEAKQGSVEIMEGLVSGYVQKMLYKGFVGLSGFNFGGLSMLDC